MADNAVSLEILVEVKESLKRLETFEKQAASSTSKVEKAFDSLKLVGEAALAYLAFDKIKDFFTESIKAAAEQEQGLARLSNAMALTGEYSKDAIADFEEFANTMQKTTKFGDDAVISQLSVAKSFGLTNDKAKELVKTAADLAAATGESLETAVHQLGITYSGTAGRLGQTIPILKGLTEEQLKAGDAVKILGERFGGSAAAEINTYAGAVQQSGNAFEDFQKAIGRVVTESPLVIARIQGMTKMWENLEKFVTENKEQLGEFVDFGIKALAVSGPVAVAVLRGLITAFQALVGTTELVIDGFLIFEAALANGIRETFGTVIDVVLQTASTLVEFAGKIPGAGDALKAIGVDTDDLSKTIDDLKTSFDETADGAVKAVENARDGMVDFTVTTDEAFKGFDEGFDKFSKAVDGGAQAIFDAGEKTQSSVDKLKNSMGGLGGATAVTAEEIKKLHEEAQKLREELAQNSTDEIGRISLAYKKQIDEIEKLAKRSVANGGISAQEAAKLRLQAEQILTQKIDKIRDDENKKFVEDAKKAAQEARQAIENIASDPVKFAVGKLEIDPAELDQATKDMAATGVGVFAKMLEGAAGAKSLISSAAGSFADALLPGIGPAVTGIISKLAEGPDAAAKFIREFIRAVPEIMVNVVKAMPAVTDAFVDEMVNHGGAAKIAYAIALAMTGIPLVEYWGQRLGKDIGISFGNSLQSPNFSRTVSGWFKDAIASLSAMPISLSKSLNNFLNGLQAAGDRLRLWTAEIPNKIYAALTGGVQSVSQGILSAFDESGRKVVEAINMIWLPIRDSIAGIGTAFTQFFSSLSGLFSNFKFPELTIPTPDWLKSFIDAVKHLNPGGKGGGKGVIQEGFDAITGHARGITEIPSGFPNDSYPAALTSGERVVDADTNTDLKRFLAGDGNGPMLGLLSQILASLQQPVQQPVTIKIDSRNIADVILSLNNRSARLAP